MGLAVVILISIFLETQLLEALSKRVLFHQAAYMAIHQELAMEEFLLAERLVDFDLP